MLQLNPQDINRLRQLMASGQITEEQLADVDIRMTNEPQQNALAPMLSEQQQFAQGDTSGRLPMGSMRNESTGKVTYFQPNAQAPRTQANPGYSDRPYPAAPQGQQQEIPRYKIAGLDGSMMYDLGEGQGALPPTNTARSPINIPGVGRGYYTMDGRSAVVDDGQGGKIKVLLGYDAQASDMRNARALAMEKTRADIAQSQQAVEASKEHVAASQQLRAKGKTTPTPSGYERNPEGGLRPIKGGPADFKQQGTYNADTATMQSSFADLDKLATSANELLNHKGLGGITGISGTFPNVPQIKAIGWEGNSADAEAKLFTLKSQVGFGVLQAMRNASKTGGALGNVSDAEGKRLEANLAALDKAQSIEQFKESLGKIVEFAQGAKDRLGNAYQMKYNGREGATAVSPSAAPSVTNSQSAIPNGAIEYLKSNPIMRQAFDMKYGTGASARVLGR